MGAFRQRGVQRKMRNTSCAVCQMEVCMGRGATQIRGDEDGDMAGCERDKDDDF